MSNRTVRTLQVTAALATLVGGAAVLANSASAKDGFEKCAGIAKAHQNDCKNGIHTCAGQASKDGDANEWVYVPTGTCSKIAGGHVIS